MNSAECRSCLIELLESHNARISRAKRYLTSIKDAIAQNQLDSLQQTLTDSDLELEDFEQLEQQRYQLLSSYGFSEDSDGFEKCVTWCDNDEHQVSTIYRQLIQNLEQLQHAIQLNSLLVTKGRDRIKRSIGILTGLGAAGVCKTYSRSGKTLSPESQRNIAIA